MIDYKKMAAKKGRDYPNAKPVPLADIPKENQRGKYSYYPLPIKKSIPDNNGNSRRWGDASDDVQKKDRYHNE